MKRVSIFDGKNKFSELVANAAQGEPLACQPQNGRNALRNSWTV